MGKRVIPERGLSEVVAAPGGKGKTHERVTKERSHQVKVVTPSGRKGQGEPSL